MATHAQFVRAHTCCETARHRRRGCGLRKNKNLELSRMAEGGDPLHVDVPSSGIEGHSSDSLREIIRQEIAAALRPSETGPGSTTAQADQSGKSYFCRSQWCAKRKD